LFVEGISCFQSSDFALVEGKTSDVGGLSEKAKREDDKNGKFNPYGWKIPTRLETFEKILILN